MRGLTIAVWVFCLNLMFTAFTAIDPFGAAVDYGLGSELIGTVTNSSSITEVTDLGVGEMIMVTNLFITLLLGPLTLVPTILNLIGITGILQLILSAAVWVTYGWTMYQLITGRMLGDAR